MNVAVEKKALRAAIRATLKALPAAAVASNSLAACTRAAALDAVQMASAVSIYLAMRHECDTMSLCDALFRAGKAVYVPRVDGGDRHDMRMLRVNSMAQLDGFPRSRWGIPEPTVEQAAQMENGLESGAIDLVIVPAVAFDALCQRLGQGRGYYDTFLERLATTRRAKDLPPPVTVGLGLQEQLVSRVPTAEHDQPLDYVSLSGTLLEATSGPA